MADSRFKRNRQHKDNKEANMEPSLINIPTDSSHDNTSSASTLSSSFRDSGYNTEASPAASISPAPTSSPASGERRGPNFVFDQHEKRDGNELHGDAEEHLENHPRCPQSSYSPQQQLSLNMPPSARSRQLSRDSTADSSSLSTPASPDTATPVPSSGNDSVTGFQYRSSNVNQPEHEFNATSDDSDSGTACDLVPSIGQNESSLSQSFRHFSAPVVEDDEDEYNDENNSFSPSWLRPRTFSFRKRSFCRGPKKDESSSNDVCCSSDNQNATDVGAEKCVASPQEYIISQPRFSPAQRSRRGRSPHRNPMDACQVDSVQSSDTEDFQDDAFAGKSDDEDVFTFEETDSNQNERLRWTREWVNMNSRSQEPTPENETLHRSDPTLVLDRPPSGRSHHHYHHHQQQQRRELFSTANNLYLAGGARLRWSGMYRNSSVSTQTPHMTSWMIQQIIQTPASLPNEARGTVASRLRCMSENGTPQDTHEPLPDIVPIQRDRSVSVPDIQALRARAAGRELRRLSDEFNVLLSRSLPPVNEVFDGHPSSFPGMGPSYIRDGMHSLGVFIRTTLSRRRGSSVDLDMDKASFWEQKSKPK